MKHQISLGLAAASIVLGLPTRADTVTWKGASDAPVTEWTSSSANWQTGGGENRLPQSGDSVVIGASAGNYKVRLSGEANRVERLNALKMAAGNSITSRLEIANGAYLSTTNRLDFGASGKTGRSELVIDGGHFYATNNVVFNVNDKANTIAHRIYGTSSITVNDGTFEIGINRKNATQYGLYMYDQSQFIVNGGSVVMGTGSKDITFYSGTPRVALYGGTANMRITANASGKSGTFDLYGGAITMPGSSLSGSAIVAFSIHGSKGAFTMTSTFNAESKDRAPWGNTHVLNFLVRNDADPGDAGVTCIDYNASPVVPGIWTIRPEGGFQIAYTNRYPMFVSRYANSKGKLVAISPLMSTAGESLLVLATNELFAVTRPDSYTIGAELREEAELPTNWEDEKGVSAGYVSVPAFSSAKASAVRPRLDLALEAKAATLEKVAAEFAANGYTNVTVRPSAKYNVRVDLPADRFPAGFGGTKVLLDFTRLGDYDATTKTRPVVTNAVMKALRFTLERPGLVLLVN